MMIVAGMLVRFQHVIPILVLAPILTIVIVPIVQFLCLKLKIPWGLAATVAMLIFILILIGASTVMGLAIVQQLQADAEPAARSAYKINGIDGAVAMHSAVPAQQKCAAAQASRHIFVGNDLLRQENKRRVVYNVRGRSICAGSSEAGSTKGGLWPGVYILPAN